MRKLNASFLIVVGLLFVLTAAAYLPITSRLENPAPAPLPPDLAGLPLSLSSYGRPAAAEINQLHRQEFLLTRAAVGVYGRSQATIWVSGSPVRFLASRMLADMVAKIALGNSPFTPEGERIDRSRTVYELTGLNQKHFYFQSGSLLVWLAADFDLAEQALTQTLEAYP
jgi:hypothetical protein